MHKVIIPMITPFKGEEIDRTVLLAFISYAKDNKFTGLFPGGSTGGFAALSIRQHKQLLKEVIEETSGLQLFAGICRNNIEETIEMGKYAIDLGYTDLVSINPFYHKYSEPSIERFFTEILDKLDSNIFVYNNPSLSGTRLKPSLVKKLRDTHPNLVGMKDSGNDFDQFREFLKIKGLQVFQGKDAVLAESIAAGAAGGVCSTANFCLNTLMIAQKKGDIEELSRKTLQLSSTISNYDVPAIHNYLFRKLILKEENPRNYVNSPFTDLTSSPDLDSFRNNCVLPP